MSQTSTTIINILFITFLLMSTFSSTKINKNLNMNMNDNAKKPSHAKPAETQSEDMPATHDSLDSFYDNRKQRQAEEKQHLTDKYNKTITEREEAMKDFQNKVNEDVKQQIQMLEKAIQKKKLMLKKLSKTPLTHSMI